MTWIKTAWFWLKYQEKPHTHVFKQSGSDTWFCMYGNCTAWYGEQNWI